MKTIELYNTVYINGKSAVVTELVDTSTTAVPKAIIAQGGMTYSVAISDLHLKEDDDDDSSN